MILICSVIGGGAALENVSVYTRNRDPGQGFKSYNLTLARTGSYIIGVGHFDAHGTRHLRRAVMG